MNIYMLYFITGEVFAHHMSAICLSCAFIHCRSVQVLIYLACHPNWEVRKVAYDATKKVLSSSSDLAEDTLYLFTDWFFISWRETVNVETRVFTCRPIDIKC